MTLCLVSEDPKFDEVDLRNFATVNVLDVLRRIPGVGRVSNRGSRYYGFEEILLRHPGKWYQRR